MYKNNQIWSEVWLYHPADCVYLMCQHLKYLSVPMLLCVSHTMHKLLRPNAVEWEEGWIPIQLKPFIKLTNFTVTVNPLIALGRIKLWCFYLWLIVNWTAWLLYCLPQNREFSVKASANWLFLIFMATWIRLLIIHVVPWEVVCAFRVSPQYLILISTTTVSVFP